MATDDTSAGAGVLLAGNPNAASRSHGSVGGRSHHSHSGTGGGGAGARVDSRHAAEGWTTPEGGETTYYDGGDAGNFYGEPLHKSQGYRHGPEQGQVPRQSHGLGQEAEQGREMEQGQEHGWVKVDGHAQSGQEIGQGETGGAGPGLGLEQGLKLSDGNRRKLTQVCSPQPQP